MFRWVGDWHYHTSTDCSRMEYAQGIVNGFYHLQIPQPFGPLFYLRFFIFLKTSFVKKSMFGWQKNIFEVRALRQVHRGGLPAIQLFRPSLPP